MTDQPNPADFSADERPNEYRVCFSVKGEVETTVTADSFEAARSAAEKLANSQDLGLDEVLDEVADIAILSVRKSPAMYRIFRDGEPMQVSNLKAGDVPRQPNDRGF